MSGSDAVPPDHGNPSSAELPILEVVPIEAAERIIADVRRSIEDLEHALREAEEAADAAEESAASATADEEVAKHLLQLADELRLATHAPAERASKAEAYRTAAAPVVHLPGAAGAVGEADDQPTAR